MTTMLTAVLSYSLNSSQYSGHIETLKKDTDVLNVGT